MFSLVDFQHFDGTYLNSYTVRHGVCVALGRDPCISSSVGRLVGRSVSCLVGWLVGWLVGCLFGWLLGYLVGYFEEFRIIPL